MALKLITPPAVEPVSTDEVKAYARVDFDDATLDLLIPAATEYVERLTGRQFVLATYDLYRDAFPVRSLGMQLPLSPLHAVESVNYVHPDTETENILAADQYEVDTVSGGGLPRHEREDAGRHLWPSSPRLHGRSRRRAQ
jgi:uncharacterized phiE125 gp8 family phage protein